MCLESTRKVRRCSYTIKNGIDSVLMILKEVYQKTTKIRSLNKIPVILMNRRDFCFWVFVVLLSSDFSAEMVVPAAQLKKQLHKYVQLFCTLKQKSRITNYAKNLTVQRRKSPIKRFPPLIH